MKKNLVLLSYGGEIEYRRAMFCIYSLLAWNIDLSKIRIIIYTDSKLFFEQHINNLLIEYLILTPELNQQLRKNTNFNHLVKVGVIDMTFLKYPGDDLCFIDTDTFFIKDPSNILDRFENGKSFLHKKEYQLSDSVKQFSSFNQGHFPIAFMNFIEGREFNIDGKNEIFDGTYYSWNTGVIALSKDFAKLMNNVTDLTIQFYENSKWFVSEQLAFSLILEKVTEIRSAENIVFHYWGKRQKAFMDKYLNDLFKQNFKYNLHNKDFKKISKKLKIEIENDVLLEQINIAAKYKSYFYAFKQSIKIVMKTPLNLKVYKKIYRELI